MGVELLVKKNEIKEHLGETIIRYRKTKTLKKSVSYWFNATIEEDKIPFVIEIEERIGAISVRICRDWETKGAQWVVLMETCKSEIEELGHWFVSKIEERALEDKSIRLEVITGVYQIFLRPIPC